MARRLVGQEQLGFVVGSQASSPLDEIDGLIDWKPVAVLLDPLYRAAADKESCPIPSAQIQPEMWVIESLTGRIRF